MKKKICLLLTFILLLASSVAIYADEIAVVTDSNSLVLELPVDTIMNEGYKFEFILGDEIVKDSADYNIQNTSSYSRITVTMKGYDWEYGPDGKLYAVMLIKATVTAGDPIKRFMANAYVYPTDMSTYYSFFDVNMHYAAGTKTLSEQYSAWVPEDETKVRVELEDIWAENIYGVDGEFSEDYRIVLYR